MRRARYGFLLCAVGLNLSCESGTEVSTFDVSCSIPTSLLLPGGPGKDGIPALSNPTLVSANDPTTAYLLPTDRVIGLSFGNEAVAIPLNIGWWHEVVNLRVGNRDLTITHCPLTGSSLAFDRAVIGGAEFGVSGLLFKNNLVMYDRRTQESLWPQLARGARCGSADRTALVMAPVIEMTWQGWTQLHPNTRVISSATGFSRNYRAYPYGDYDRIDNAQLLFPLERIDGRRPPKERVLGIAEGESGIALPFGELEKLGALAAVPVHVAGQTVIVLWDRARSAAMAFEPRMAGSTLEFEVRGGNIIDRTSGSVWTVDGRAVSGPHTGQQLQPIAQAYVAFWFAWAEFQPDASVWSAN